MARIRDLAALLFGVAVAAVVALLVANSFIMPRIVEHNEARQVPNVVGQPVEVARRACVDAGLQLVEDGRSHSVELPPGHVVSQVPAAGTAVRPGRSVRVTVSLGRESVSVPELRGSTLRQARLQLANAQLTVGDVCRLDGPPPGEIVRATSPPAGSEAARGDSVDLLVTTGVENEPYLMPALVGQEQSAVRALVESRGFRIGRVTTRTAHGVFPGTVLEQYPPRGAWIRQGESVDLVVADSD
jgi:eukaryotic-like serine/threonine-protein kinase